MGKLSEQKTAQGPRSPIASTGVQTFNQEGSAAWRLEAKGELFTLAATNMVSEKTFYESAADRDTRFAGLVRAVAIDDPAWIAGFAPYLRSTLNMRTASIVLAVEAVLAWREHKVEMPAGVTVRRLIDSVCQRADEPGELISYWQMTAGRRSLPGGVQRGLADACARLFDERAAIKWDGQSKSWRLGDVLEVVHPKARPVLTDANVPYRDSENRAVRAEWQSETFRWLLNRRRHADTITADQLAYAHTLRAYGDLKAMDNPTQRAYLLADPTRLRAAGVTWEYLSGLGPMDHDAWAAASTNMGYMATLRNLRNFDHAGLTDAEVAPVIARLTDPEQVARSRQLPYRFLTAYKTAPSLRWSYPLAVALEASVGNAPHLPGRTLVLIDTSASMNNVLSAKSTVTRVDAAAVLAFALAGSCEHVDVVGYASGIFAYPHDPTKGVLKQAAEVAASVGVVGHGTMTSSAVRWAYGRDHRGPGNVRHDRVIICTDDQSQDGDPGAQMPPDVPLFIFDLGGYGRASVRAGIKNRHVVGGLTDASFELISVLSSGKDATWPF